MSAKFVDGLPGEEAVGAGHCGFGNALLGEFVHEFDDRAAGGDLVVEHDGPLADDIADDRVDDHTVVTEPPLGAGRHGKSEESGELGGVLGIAQVGGHDHAVGEVLLAEVLREDTQAGQVIDRDREEAVHLGSMKVHREDPVSAGRRDQVRHESTPEADPRGVLLVRAGVGEVRDDGGDLRGRGSPGRVDHEQQLHQRVLRGRHQWLHDVDVTLTAVGQELGLQAIVAEAADRGVGQGDAQVVTDAGGEGRVGVAREDDDIAHGVSLGEWSACSGGQRHSPWRPDAAALRSLPA